MARVPSGAELLQGQFYLSGLASPIQSCIHSETDLNPEGRLILSNSPAMPFCPLHRLLYGGGPLFRAGRS